MSIRPSASFATSLETPAGVCALSDAPLNVDQIIQSVGDGSAGATAIFIGTTRNSFQGRSVTRLDYQAYSKLAVRTMGDIICKVKADAPLASHQLPSQPAKSSIIRCAAYHRLGTVKVGEPSIVIAVSSIHRREAFNACEAILEEIKLRAQIWKREFYEGESEANAEWKANN